MPDWVRPLLDVPLKVVLIVAGALVLRALGHRLIDRISRGIAAGQAGLLRLDEKLLNGASLLAPSPAQAARREQRARTTASVLRSATTAAVGVVAVLTVLPVLGVETVPLLASASVVGVALGLGAQALVKDVLAGLFMLVEDQYGVGDVVDLGSASGTVESVGLRVTRLRDDGGTVWYIRNGEVLRVGNRSQSWARAVLDIDLDPGLDLRRVRLLLLDVARGLAADPELGSDLLAEPEVLGIEAVTKDTVALRLVVRTVPLRQGDVARELRRRILDRFADEKLPAPVGMALAAGTS